MCVEKCKCSAKFAMCNKKEVTCVATYYTNRMSVSVLQELRFQWENVSAFTSDISIPSGMGCVVRLVIEINLFFEKFNK